MNYIKISLFVFFAFLLFLVGCTFLEEKKPQENLINILPTLDKKSENQNISLNLSLEENKDLLPTLKKFSSYKHMQYWLDQNSYNAAQEQNLRVDVMLKPLGLKSPSNFAQRTEDYSKTNIQVEGIDEPDIIKTTKNNLFVVKENKIFIFEIFPKPKKIFEKKLELNQIHSIFVEDDYLVLFSTDYKKTYKIDEFDFKPYESYEPYTVVQIYNISDKSNPILFQEFRFSGYFTQARLKDKKIYLISSQDISKPYPRPWYYSKDLFYVDVYYFDMPSSSNYKISQISVISLDGKILDSKAFLLNAGGDTVYMSDKNLYIAVQIFPPIICRSWWCTNTAKQINKTERFEKAILPYLPVQIRQEIGDILKKNITDEEKWMEIEPILLNYLKKFEDETKVSKSQLEEFKLTLEKISMALAEYDALVAIKNQKTAIFKFSFLNDTLKLLSSNYVNGYLLNQWALDEQDENLRVATTIDVWAAKRVTYNSIYILDKDLNLISKLDELAPEEKIYSVRFMGQKVYLVTYKEVDPLFVIDLSDALHPKVLGYLKIPGYFTYLHPYNETLLIGIGQTTSTSLYGFEVRGGIKVGLIDVSNPQKPKLLAEFAEGDEGTTSSVLSDHKAFVFDKNKKILYLPLKLVKKQKSLFYDKIDNFYGVYVLNLSDQDITPIGKIEHYSSSDLFEYKEDYFVKRVAYFGDILASVSDRLVIFSDGAKNFETVERFQLN
ncbi:MAG: beta-propeller domain-containing protein [Candidatus Anstonellaceae archaeon]